MNKRFIRNVIFAIVIILSVCVVVPNAKKIADRFTEGNSTQVKEKVLVSQSTSVKSATPDKVSVKLEDNAEKDIVKTTEPNAASGESSNQLPLSDNNSNKINSNNSGSSSSSSSSSSNSSNSSNSTSNSVSRGGNAADTSKYPQLSKVNGLFGQFNYRDLSGGRIDVDPQWAAEHIVTITLPGLNRQVQVHKDAADNFITAFNYIKNGTAIINGQEVTLLSLIKTMDGTYVTRHVNWNPERGLSNHSWGTAIDINADGHFGYVDANSDPNDPNLILWEKAFEPAGFSWGNRYSDSMHYELIK